MAQTIQNTGLYQQETPQTKKKSAQQICEEKGGYWDSRTGTCFLAGSMTDTTPAAGKAAVNTLKGIKEPSTPQVNPKVPEVYRDEETGKLSGITLPNGKSYVGISPADVKNFASKYNESVTLPEGTQAAGTAQIEANRQARLQQLMQLGQQGLLTSQELQAIQEAPIDWSQALTSGVSNAIPNAIGFGVAGAGAGAAAGLLGGPAAPISVPAGAVIGGVAGILKGLYSGVTSNIKSQQSGEIAKTKDVLAAARTNMKALSLIVSKDPTKAEEAINLYYDQLAQVNRAYRQLQMETQGDLNKFMNDGTQDLSDFELFLQPGGYAEIQRIRLEQALYGGTPVSDEELAQFYNEEFTNE